MTALTDNDTLEDLSTFLTEYGVVCEHADVDKELYRTTDYVEEIETHNCANCGANISTVPLESGRIRVVCSGDCNRYATEREELMRYRLYPKRILHDIADVLGYEDVEQAEKHDSGYVIATAATNTRLALIYRPDAQETALDELIGDSVTNGRVNAVFTPTEFEDLKWDSVLRRPLAASAPPFPLEFLAESGNAIRQQLDSAAKVHERRESVLPRVGGDTELLRHLNQNPRAIQLELEYAPLFRAEGTPNSRRLGDRFEDVCGTALETMGLSGNSTELGQGQGNVTDILFAITNDSRLSKNHGGGKILGIVDAKSNAKAEIGAEDIVQKHAEYLQQANTPAFDDFHIAHVFVVLSMKGYESNEVAWYDDIEASDYGKNVEDITMVVLYADALAHMLDIHLTSAERNEMNLSLDGIHDFYRPFFNYRAFKREVDPDIREITRVDDRDPNAYEKGYRREYRQRERLLVVTREMVHKHYRRTVDDHAMLGDLLSMYGETL